MRILAINCGSTSLKFRLFDVSLGEERCLLNGQAKIGKAASFSAKLSDGTVLSSSGFSPRNHEDALQILWDTMSSVRGLERSTIQATGHRFVHGGNVFLNPALIDDTNLMALRRTAGLDRVHNEPAIAMLERVREDLGADVPMVTVFDTAFHQTIPEKARRYPLPEELVQKHNLWRFGFHGLAHRWMSERYDQIAEPAAPAARLITIQLGGGCSVAAISDGRPADTSMGMTPTEGLMMGTRCGDLDPMISLLLAKREGLSLAQVEELLYQRSGLLGVSGLSGDVSDLLEAEHQLNMRARLALDMFCYRLQKYIGAYLAVLGGADAIIFGGGIGENQPAIRSRVCRGMEWAGIQLSESRNRNLPGGEGCISERSGKVPVYVIPVNEEALVARDTYDCLARHHAIPRKECHAC